MPTNVVRSRLRCRRSRKALLQPSLLVLCLCVAALASACALRDGVRTPPSPASAPRGGGQFNVCVRAVAGATFGQRQAQAALQAAYSTIVVERRWSHPTLWWQSPVLDFTCADEPVLLHANVKVSKGALNSVRLIPDDVLNRPNGRYLRYYFVLPRSEIDRLFFGDSYVPGHRNQVQEAECRASTEAPRGGPPDQWPPDVLKPACEPLSIGTYLTADEIESASTMLPAVRYLHGAGR